MGWDRLAESALEIPRSFFWEGAVLGAGMEAEFRAISKGQDTQGSVWPLQQYQKGSFGYG